MYIYIYYYICVCQLPTTKQSPHNSSPAEEHVQKSKRTGNSQNHSKNGHQLPSFPIAEAMSALGRRFNGWDSFADSFAWSAWFCFQARVFSFLTLPLFGSNLSRLEVLVCSDNPWEPVAAAAMNGSPWYAGLQIHLCIGKAVDEHADLCSISHGNMRTLIQITKPRRKAPRHPGPKKKHKNFIHYDTMKCSLLAAFKRVIWL